MTSGRGQFEAIPCGRSGVEAVEARSRHGFPPHMHDEYGIGLIRRGAQRSRSGRGMVEAGAGDVITCNPGEVHDGHPIGDAGRAWTMLYFEPRLIAEAAEGLGDGGKGTYAFALPRLRSRRIAGRFRRLFAALTSREGAEIWCGDELLLGLLGDLIEQESVPPVAARPCIARARARIDDDPASAATLSDLAREAGLSRFQLLREFARATGFTPHAYLVQRRLHAARRLIGRGTPLAEAAAAAGFADQSHMTRLFVRNYGFSPGAYARAVG